MNILDSGINLMLYGMGTVFVFLTILIVTTMLMSRVINHFFGQEQVVSTDSGTSSNGGQIEKDLLSILQAAVNTHKNRQ